MEVRPCKTSENIKKIRKQQPIYIKGHYEKKYLKNSSVAC